MLISSILTAALCAASCVEVSTKKPEIIEHSIRNGIAEEKAYVLDCYKNNLKAEPTLSRSYSYPLNQNDVAEYLETTYGGSGWHMGPAHCCDCGGLYGVYKKYEPREFNDPKNWSNGLNGYFYNIIHAAEQAAGWTGSAIGCGRLAIISVLDYLYRSAGYYEIGNPTNDEAYLTELVTNVINNTGAISLDIVNAGTYSDMALMKMGLRDLFHFYHLDRPLDIGTFYPYDDPFLLVDAPSSAWDWTADERIESVVSSILGGMPVIWRTWGTMPGSYQAHYMNLYGYETWECGQGDNYQSHLMFKVRMNHGRFDETNYADSSWVGNSFYGTIITVRERFEHFGYEYDEFGFPCSYNDTPITTTHFHGWNHCSVTRLRTGTVRHYDQNGIFDSYRLTMSAQRNNYTDSYFDFNLPKKAVKATYYLSKWGSDYFESNDSLVFKRYGNNYDEDYPLALHTLTSNYSEPAKIEEYFDDNELELNTLGLHLHSSSTGNDRNKKRINIQYLSIVTEKPYTIYD